MKLHAVCRGIGSYKNININYALESFTYALSDEFITFIQNELNNKKIMTTVTNLSVKIGIGFGDCALLYVGGIFNRSEFFTVGDALT